MDAEITVPTVPAIAEPTPPSAPAPASEATTTTAGPDSDPSAGVPFPPPPILTLDRIIIRPLHMRDVPAMVAKADDEGVAANMSNRFPYPYTPEKAREFLTMVIANAAHDYAICLKEKPEDLVGVIGIRIHGDVEWRTRELGYWVAREVWGQGIMTEATVGFCRWAFDEIPEMRRIEGGCYGHNAGSARVMVKAGFTPEGTRRLAIEKNGVMTDAKVFGLLREECPGVKSKTVTGTHEEELKKKKGGGC